MNAPAAHPPPVSVRRRTGRTGVSGGVRASAPAALAGADLVAALRQRLAARHGPVVLIETHISWVLLAGEHAYKIKKPLALPFLDFSTLAARRHWCAEEMRLNARLAPGLYVGVVPIRLGARGPGLGGRGPEVEVALKMHRLPPHCLGSERLAAGTLRPEDLCALGLRLAAFHESAEVAGAGTSDTGEFGAASRVQRDMRDVLERLAPLVPSLGGAADEAPSALTRIGAWVDHESPRLAPHWQRRRAGGRVRECHGDLHLDNIVLLPEGPTAFDGIEFDPALRWIDVASDIAFLRMDLLAHGRRDLASVLLDAWLEGTGDHDALTVLPFYGVYRALVRALVAALRARAGLPVRGPSAAEYLRLAERGTQPATPRLLVTHGLPGAGKTWVTQQLLERAGAVRLRSDVERKRLAHEVGIGRAALYSPESTVATYAQLEARARVALEAGCVTIVDAACLRRIERDRFRALAAALGVPFTLLHCDADDTVLRERIVARQRAGRDASDANLDVLARLQRAAEPLAPDEAADTIALDTGRPLALAPLLARWLGAAAAPA